MKALALGAILALGLALAAPAGAGLTEGSGELTIVHAATFDAGDPFPVTLCIDGDIVNDDFEVGDIIGPDTTPAGTYDVDIFTGAGKPDCTGLPQLSTTVEVQDGDDLTVMAYWDNAEFNGPALTVLDNDNDCTEPGEGRLTARHAADAPAVNVVADAQSTSPVEIFSDLENGQQATTDLAADTYPDVEVQQASDDSLVVDLGDVTITEAEQLVVYVIGGADGDVGFFTDTIDEDTCDQPTTTTTSTTVTPALPVTPVTPAIPATPVAVQPAYTG